MVRGNMRGGRGGVRVGMRGSFNKKASFSKFFFFLLKIIPVNGK